MRINKLGNVFISFILIIFLVLFFGCGGDEDDWENTDSGCWVNMGIDTPTYEGTWETDKSSIDLGGPLPTPDDQFYTEETDCREDPGYDVTWYNVDTGTSGTGWAVNGRGFSFFFGYFCYTVWGAYSVPLGSGDNHIAIYVMDEAGCRGEDAILIRRLPPPADLPDPETDANS